MHEMAITQSVVDAVCEHAAGRRVHSVTLEVGALCAVVPDSMEFCFELATEGTVAEGASLDIDMRPGAGRCRACGGDEQVTGSSRPIEVYWAPALLAAVLLLVELTLALRDLRRSRARGVVP